jgi:hypothetical protein
MASLKVTITLSTETVHILLRGTDQEMKVLPIFMDGIVDIAENCANKSTAIVENVDHVILAVSELRQLVMDSHDVHQNWTDYNTIAHSAGVQVKTNINGTLIDAESQTSKLLDKYNQLRQAKTFIYNFF